MRKFIASVDHLNQWVGKGFSWCIVVLCFSTCYEVFVAKVFRAPTYWAFDFSLQMYGALFIMAGAYTLSTEAHVRGDVIYRYFPARAQAWLDLILYFIFFFPGILALAVVGMDYAGSAWNARETSWNSPAEIQIYGIKTLIPVAGWLLFLQGLSEVCRCIICIRSGHWPARSVVVEETEAVLTRASKKQDVSDVI